MTRRQYDKRVWTFLLTCTTFVVLVMLVAIALGALGPYWLLLPASWLVGGGMTWAFDKYNARKVRYG